MNGGGESSERILAALSAPATEPGVVALYLFGSAADDRMHRESDVDVGVLLDRTVHPTPRDRFEARLRLVRELGTRTQGRAVDVAILNDAPPELASRVVARGRLLVCTDPRLEHAFRRDAQLRAADLAPFLRRTRARKLESMKR